MKRNFAGKKMNGVSLKPISGVISISATPMVLFAHDLKIVAANAGGRTLLRSGRSIYPVVRKTFLGKKQVTKKIRFNRNTWILNSCPLFEGGNVTGALVTVRED